MPSPINVHLKRLLIYPLNLLHQFIRFPTECKLKEYFLCLILIRFVFCLVKNVLAPRDLPSSKCCNLYADVTFLLDASALSKSSFVDMKYFIKALSFMWYFDDSKMKRAVVSFSYKIELSINFDDHNNMTSFGDAVDQLNIHKSPVRRIDNALRFAQTHIFNKSSGVRERVPKTVVLITDGPQANVFGADDPTEMANKLRELGVHVFVVGVGSTIEESELNGIGQDLNNVFIARTNGELVLSNFVNNTAGSIFTTSKFGSFFIL